MALEKGFAVVELHYISSIYVNFGVAITIVQMIFNLTKNFASRDKNSV